VTPGRCVKVLDGNALRLRRKEGGDSGRRSRRLILKRLAGFSNMQVDALLFRVDRCALLRSLTARKRVSRMRLDHLQLDKCYMSILSRHS
jgi:hypothetical protein